MRGGAESGSQAAFGVLGAFVFRTMPVQAGLWALCSCSLPRSAPLETFRGRSRDLCTGLFPFQLPEPGSFPMQPRDFGQRFGPLHLPCAVIQRSFGSSGAEGKGRETWWITAALGHEGGAGKGLCRRWLA